MYKSQKFEKRGGLVEKGGEIIIEDIEISLKLLKIALLNLVFIYNYSWGTQIIRDNSYLSP